ncbi:MAG: ABC transporter substrate-binding protein [Christensenellales bacterium]|jgi:multiple sugar transport system substrate-binding protein
MKRTLAIVLALVMVLLLAAPAISESSAEKVHLVFVERYGNTTRTASLRGLLDEFEQQNPDIEIELISPPLETSQQKISQMLLAQDALDILEVTAWEYGNYLENEWLHDLTDYYANYPDKETFIERVSSTLQEADGKYYQVPIGCYERLIYYRVDWLEELGLTLPEPGPEWTYDALFEIAKAMTDPEKGRYGWALRGGGNSYQQFIEQVMEANIGWDNLLSDAEYRFTADGKSIYRSEAAKKGVEFQRKFYEECCPKDSIAWLFTDQVTAFASGVCGLLMQDSDCIGTFKAEMEEGTWATYPMPVDAETGCGMIGKGADGWAMTAHTKHPDEAWRVLAYLGSPEINTRFCKDYGVIPIHTTASEYDEEFKTGYYAPYIFMFSHPEMYHPLGGVNLPYSSFFSEFGDSSDTDLQNFLMGNLDADAMLLKWAEQWEAAREEFGGLE